MAYARPVLCRLCGFPASDGGVPVSEVDREKLSEWCLRMMDTELDEEGVEKAVFCQFCVWQARFLEENRDLTKESSLIWWKKHIVNDADYKFFLNNMVQQCAVTIAPISKQLLKKHNLMKPVSSPTKSGKRRQQHKCIYCAALLSTKKILVSHVNEEHKNDSTFKCSKCAVFFLNRREKNNHMKKLHRGSKFKCTHCPRRFSRILILANHVKVEHSRKLIRCNYRCGAYFKTDEMRKKHCQEQHEVEEKVGCIYCEKYFQKRKLMQHIKTSHAAISIKCNFFDNCSTFFHTEQEREQHVLDQHENGFDRVECLYCQKRVLKKFLTRHMKETHEDVSIKCPYHNCSGSYFHSTEERQRHVLEMHESDDTKYRCIYCKKMIANLAPRIIQHINFVHKTEAIKCDYQYHCHNFFLTLEEKQKHILEVHESGEDKIRCQFCPRMVRIQGMRDHIRIHHRSEGSKGEGSPVERVECIYCKGQMKKINLAVHMARKHKLEAIKCNFSKRCGTYFKTLEDMQKHIAEKHQTGKKVEDSKCCFCKNVYSCRATLKGHIKDRHPNATKCKQRGCWEYFSSKKKAEEHFEEVHAPEERGKTFQCSYCNFTSTSREEKDAHSAQVHQKATVRCQKCPKMFKSESALKIHHKVVHLARRACPHCQNLVLVQTWALHLEMSSCPTCKASFRCRGIRSKHPRSCIRNN